MSSACASGKQMSMMNYSSAVLVPFQAVTRHHGDYSVMGNSFPPTFPEDLLAHASQ